MMLNVYDKIVNAVRERDVLIKRMKELEAIILDRRIIGKEYFGEISPRGEYYECSERLEAINKFLCEKMLKAHDNKSCYYYREVLLELEAEEEEKKRNEGDKNE